MYREDNHAGAGILCVVVATTIKTKRSVVSSVKKNKDTDLHVGSQDDSTNLIKWVTSVDSVQIREVQQKHVYFSGRWRELKNTQLLDSEASSHMTLDRDDFCTLQPVKDDMV